MFTHLHVHTCNSIMDGMSTIEDIASRVSAMKQPGFAITDHGTVAGLIQGYEEAKKRELLFAFGEEFYFCPDISVRERGAKHLILLAKNNEGYKNLLKLTTIAHRDGFYYKPRIDYNILAEHSRGLIATSACIGGILSDAPSPENVIRWFQKQFGEDFYLELGTNIMPKQLDYNDSIVAYAQKYGVPLIVTSDSHYTREEDAEAHRRWISMGEDRKGDYYRTDDYFLMDEATVRARINYLPDPAIDEAVANTEKILRSCEVTLPFGEKHYPVFPVADQTAKIKELCARVPEGEEYQQRLEYEQGIIKQLDFENYFLIVHDLLNHCHESGIRTGIGRGSVVGSLVSYAMRITHLDPVKRGLLFERFAHPFRAAMPDIDMDFPRSKREKVIQYIRERWGRTYQVRTYSYCGFKAALQRAGQALKIEPAWIDSISKECLSIEQLKKKTKYSELVELTKKYDSVVQSHGTHASAVMVFPDDPENWCAIERQGSNFVTSYKFEHLEAMGLLKLDCLGLNTLDVLDMCLELIGEDIDIDNLPDDDFTWEMLCRGDTAGVFQVESPGMTKLMKDAQPHSHDDLTALVALYRPGVINSGMLDIFVANKKSGNVKYLHPKLEKILKETYGVIVYQEQIQKIAQELCGYSLGEGDLLRRAVAKKKKEEMEKIIPEFVQRGVERGVDREVMRELASQIEKFAEYGFNQSHSAAYAMITYQTAYLKANYPLQYMCALLNSELGDQEKTGDYVYEAQNLGLRILPPSPRSKHEWTIEDNALRVGFGAIKNVGNTALDLDEVYTFEEFIAKNHKVNNRVIESLIYAGFFGEEGKEFLLDKLHWYKNWYKRLGEINSKVEWYTGNEAKTAQWLNTREKHLSMQYELGESFPAAEHNEREMLGFRLGESAINLYDIKVTRRDVIAGEVIRFKNVKDKKGQQMAFVKCNTVEGTKELVMFSSRYVPLVEGEVYLFEVEKGNVIRQTAKPEKK